MPKAQAAKSKPYHHGDLRRQLLDSALELIAESGPSAISLRELSRRAGVSNAAPTHHFGDKPGLLTALATEGFELLAATLGDAWERSRDFLEVGVAYVRFATTHRAHFDLMFRVEMYRADDPDLVAAQAAARKLLYGPIVEAGIASADTAAVAAWSMMHGLSWLWLSGMLPEFGDDPQEIARSIGTQLFQAPDFEPPG